MPTLTRLSALAGAVLLLSACGGGSQGANDWPFFRPQPSAQAEVSLFGAPLSSS